MWVKLSAMRRVGAVGRVHLSPRAVSPRRSFWESPCVIEAASDPRADCPWIDHDCTRSNPAGAVGNWRCWGDRAQMMTFKRRKRLRMPRRCACRAMTSQAQLVLLQALTSRARGHDDAARAGSGSRHRDLWLDPGALFAEACHV